ncbi:MAG: SusE domain-containing protein [Bacteroidales bacterium]|jgi:hypothetical protein|nr:SusE domain-containing protein [Bacteroidales bacterium]
MLKNRLYIFLLLLFVVAACDDEPEITVLKELSFPAQIELTQTDFILDGTHAMDTVMLASWAAVDYQIEALVLYSLEFTTRANAEGDKWSQIYTKEIGYNILSSPITVSELNNIAFGFGLEANNEGELLMRVKAFVDRAAYSNQEELSVTPYGLVKPDASTLWVFGDFQAWDPSTAPILSSPKVNSLYEGYIYIPEGGTNDFKLAATDSWAGLLYGDGSDGQILEVGADGSSFYTPSSGYYNLTADLNTMSYTITKTTWSILGDASPGEWTTDTQMYYDEVANVWKIDDVAMKVGSFKFRANNAWNIDFGADDNGDLVYVDHPVLGYTPEDNIMVSQAGNYTLILDLSDPTNYNYQLIEK